MQDGGGEDRVMGWIVGPGDKPKGGLLDYIVRA